MINHVSRPEVCELCEPFNTSGVLTLVTSDQWRVVRVLDQPDYPAFWRVIWRDHVSELTDLVPDQRSHLMQTVCKVEQVIRSVLQPYKINLASLGNVVPHLHWHIIARWPFDAHFPQPIWGMQQRIGDELHKQKLHVQLPAVDEAIIQTLTTIVGAT